MKKTLFFAGTLALFLSNAYGQSVHPPKEMTYAQQPPFNPPGYVCYKTPGPITVDGKLSPEEWDAIPWTTNFADIEGDKGAKPYLQTKMKMAHDDNGMYFAAWLEEPHIWATLTEHDATIFQDNAFEMFFNPTNDTHHYLEYEVNALGTVWDLYLSKPYRDNPVTFSNWEFNGMKSAVYLDGTLNDPTDTDHCWTVEVFIPWRSLYQVMPRVRKPADGDQIRANFMRVQWPLEVKEGKYVKIPKKEGTARAESYWLWAPIGIVSAHLPEYWGYIQFTETIAGKGEVAFKWNPDEDIKWALRQLYLRQREFRQTHGYYTSNPADLKPAEVCPAEWLKKISIETTSSMYEISLSIDKNNTWNIRQDGLVWQKKPQVQR
ncbi:carbohydrate-binding family 9-like protein [Parabacteroides sp. PF5-9]|uniref:carbohydrate-binding family 9-like protein n=1 Tax=Parabacteroides sp. PF5-9 TaxID=1742404 RepID=UPI002475AC7D|nr:carbohydrate-binding family 9-like protein [Parabacteroides sp. PF5-9]MDH6358734.1 hypothetical protein [Parabacteroides sp. PF5-9]